MRVVPIQIALSAGSPPGARDVRIVDVERMTMLAMRLTRITAAGAAFLRAVLDVLRLRDRHQVTRVHARRVIAAMSHHQARRDRPNKQLESHAVRPALMSRDPEAAIPARTVSIPEPTAFRPRHIAKEAVNHRVLRYPRNFSILPLPASP
jgi:hypothetical protein